MKSCISPKRGRYDRGCSGGTVLAIPDGFLDELVGRTDITELVKGYVRLTKRSGSNMFGLCPFHSESTPSFSVNSEKQIYHCFGCGKGGGAIGFIMEIENVAFRDAVEVLARRVGMTVPEGGASEDVAGKRRRMLELNRDAARHFYEMLSSAGSGHAREYLAKRGISKTAATKFGIGAAPDSRTLLLDAMVNKGYTNQELTEAGLVRKGREGSGIYDVFRNRLMFPVIDVRGGVIGFSGRILGDGEPKYLNSPDTLVFSKRRNLFALNLAKKSKSGMLILAEGNIDVVSLHQAGFDSAVASLGTALTEEQARLMARYTQKAVIAYDSDEAGHRATLRAIPLLEKTGMSIKVLEMGEGVDPDDYLRKNGADAFAVLLERSDNHIEYRLMTIRNRFDLKTDEGRVSYLAAATELLSELGSEPEREVYGARVAREAGISPDSVKNEVAKKYKARKAKQKQDFDRLAARPKNTMQPDDRSLQYTNEGSAAAEEGVIRCLVRDAALMRVITEMGLSHEEFTSPFLAKVFQMLSMRISEGRDTRESMILSELPANEASVLTAIMQKPESIPDSEKTVREYIGRIRTEKFRTDAPDTDMLMEIMKYKKESEQEDLKPVSRKPLSGRRSF